jgi:glycosyltransferase involved in cell wall biosynthesis
VVPGNALVTVITPTWERHDTLMHRCIPSVEAQTYPHIEHIVISDGPDPWLREHLTANLTAPVRFAELPEHPEQSRWGHYARVLGLAMAHGDYIAYLDDDNAFRPQHIERLAADLDNHTVAGFTYSRMLFHSGSASVELGSPPPRCGQIDTSMIMHRIEILDTATWLPSLPTVDWDLVQRWMVGGIEWSWVDEVTVDYYKS